jgi:GH35 family endo-1,4-beta-xylanase
MPGVLPRCLGLAGLFVLSHGLAIADTPVDEADLDRRIAALRQGDFIVRVQDADGNVPKDPISYTLVRHEFPFGTAVSAHHLLANTDKDPDAKRYQEILVKHFNCAVSENAHKWAMMERQPGEPRGATALGVWEKCRDLGLPMRGHCVMWGLHYQVQGWLKALPPDKLEDAIKARMRYLFWLFDGKITEWDLNNEMMHGDYYGKKLELENGAPYFKWAKEIAPDNVYYVNDHRALSEDADDMYVHHVRILQEAGAAVGGIGEQGHFNGKIPSTERLWTVLDKLGQYKLPVKVTEFDINTKDEAQQAEDTRRFYKICFAHPAVAGITMWGFWEGRHWRPEGASWRRDWSIKPNGEAYLQLMEEWRSKGEAKPDKDGDVRFRGFFGEYEVISGDARARVVLHRDSERSVSITLQPKPEAQKN